MLYPICYIEACVQCANKGEIRYPKGWRFYLMGPSLSRTGYSPLVNCQQQLQSAGELFGPRTNLNPNKTQSKPSNSPCSSCVPVLAKSSPAKVAYLFSPLTIEFVMMAMCDNEPQIVPINYPEFPFVCENGDYRLERQFVFDIHRGKITENDFHQLNDFQKGVYFFIKRDYTKAQGHFDGFLEKNPNHSITMYYTLLINLSRNFVKGLAQFNANRSLVISPYLLSKVYQEIGYHYLLADNFSRAINAFSDSMKYNKDNQISIYYLGLLSWDRFTITKSENDLEAALRYFQLVNASEYQQQKAESNLLNVSFLDSAAKFNKDYSELSIENVKKAIEKIPEFNDKLNFIQAVWEYNIKYVPNQNNFRSLPKIIQEGRSGDCDDYLQFFIDVLFPNNDLNYKLFINNTSVTTFHVMMAIQDKIGARYYVVDVKKPIIRYYSINFLYDDFTKRVLEGK